MAQKKGNKRVSFKKQTRTRRPKSLANNASPAKQVRPGGKRKLKKSKGGPKGHGMKHVHAVCSVTDPFCPAAKNQKWPDGTSGNTLTEQFRGSVTVSSGASGTNAIAFAGAAPFGYLTTSASGASSVTFGATWATYKTSSLLATYGSQYRIVSCGVIARSVASAVNSSGLITFGTTGTPALTGQVLTLGSELYDEVEIKAIQPGLEFCWISQPRGPTAREFQTQSTSANPLVEWTSLVVELSGCPISTPVINFEWYVNVEFTATANAALTALAVRNPAKSTAAEQSVSKVHNTLGSFIEGGIKQVEQSVAKHASEALSSLMDDPLESLASLFAML